MTLKCLGGAIVAAVVCVSCGEKEPASSGQARSGKTLAGAADTTRAGANKQGELRLPGAPVERPAPGTVGAAPTAEVAAPKPADVSDMPLAPKDAQWTIYCATLRDENHVETSRALKAALIKNTGLREWYILHESDRSRLYYGYYRSISDASDAAETARAQADRKKINEMKDKSGERPFAASQFVQLSAPDPEAPPQWNLVNVPQDKVWTLMIGAYKDSPDRKRAAVEAVRDARASGEEAYYYHGESVSNVFIGTWREEAVEETRIDTDAGRRSNSRDDLLVMPPGIKDPGKVVDKSGKTVRAVSQKLIPVDESLKKKIAQYPEMGVNGERLVYKARGKSWVQGPQLIRIPRPSQTLFRDDGVANGAPQQLQPSNDGRGLDAPDPFARPGYVDNGPVKRKSTVQQQQPGQLRSLDSK
jgi:hypothetical protein